jgi:hypothetical protein
LTIGVSADGVFTPETGHLLAADTDTSSSGPATLAAYQAELRMLANERMHSAMRGDKMGAGWRVEIHEVPL